MSWNTYVSKVQKQLHPDMRLSSKSKEAMNALVNHIIDKIVEISNKLVKARQIKVRRPTAVHTITTSLIYYLPETLADQTIMAATKANCKYNQSIMAATTEYNVRKRMTIEKRAGLVFSVARIERAMTDRSSLLRKSIPAAIYLTATIEYLVAEVLSYTVELVFNRKKRIITPNDIFDSIHNDEGLDSLFSNKLKNFIKK